MTSLVKVSLFAIPTTFLCACALFGSGSTRASLVQINYKTSLFNARDAFAACITEKAKERSISPIHYKGTFRLTILIREPVTRPVAMINISEEPQSPKWNEIAHYCERQVTDSLEWEADAISKELARTNALKSMASERVIIDGTVSEKSGWRFGMLSDEKGPFWP